MIKNQAAGWKVSGLLVFVSVALLAMVFLYTVVPAP